MMKGGIKSAAGKKRKRKRSGNKFKAGSLVHLRQLNQPSHKTEIKNFNSFSSVLRFANAPYSLTYIPRDVFKTLY